MHHRQLLHQLLCFTPCAGNPTDLSVSSSNSGYSYTWSSDPSGFSASGTGPHTVTPTDTTSYIMIADISGGL
ncbi:MAG: hypothetical protein R2829_10010 [Bacteroidia bacterium]